MSIKTPEHRDIRHRILSILTAVIFILMTGALAIVLLVPGDDLRMHTIYTWMVSILIVLDLGAHVLLNTGRYTIAVVLVIIMAIAGPWGSLLLDSSVGVTDMYPLLYVTVSVLLSSIFLSFATTIVIASIQYVALIGIIVFTPGLSSINWASFLVYIATVFVLSIATNYIARHHLQQLQEFAIRDHLTGLFNRRYLDDILEQRLFRVQQKHLPLCLILFDIDGFKSYNDRFGHAAGDMVLQRIGAFITDRIQIADTACRYGGDEMVVILPGTPLDEGCRIAEQLRSGVRDLHMLHKGKELGRVSITLGVACHPEHGTTGKELLAHADAALFTAKELGKDRVRC